MRQFAEEMDHLFESFGLRAGLPIPGALSRGHELPRGEVGFSPRYGPRASTSSNTTASSRSGADLPGFNRDEIKVDVIEDMLTIQGERKRHDSKDREGYCYNECTYGNFCRTVALPAGADTAQATAFFHNGVLEVAMPIASEIGKKPRLIEVRDSR